MKQAVGGALHVRPLLENPVRTLLIFNGLQSRYCRKALLGYHYRAPLVGAGQASQDGVG
jgi:hypothetical protein